MQQAHSGWQALCVLCTSQSPDRPRTTLGVTAAETVLLSLHLGVCEKEESKHECFLATPRGTGSPAGTCGVQSERGAQARGQWKSRGTLLCLSECLQSPLKPQGLWHRQHGAVPAQRAKSSGPASCMPQL